MYVSTQNQEWPEEKYPPWAHGPGYIVSRDIAESVSKLFKEGNLKVLLLFMLSTFRNVHRMDCEISKL